MPDNWMPYLTQADDMPASVFVNIGVAEAEAKRWPHLIFIKVAVRERRENGFPSRQDFAEVSDLEDQLAAAVGADGRYVGRLSTGEAHYLHVYTRRPQPHAAALRELCSRLKQRKVELRVEEDPKWSVYFEHLYPSLVELQAFKDDLVLQQLRDNGDDLSKRRPVEHWFYMPDANSRKRLAQCLSKEGFRIVELHEPETAGEAFGLRMARVESVQPEHIKQVTVHVLELTHEHGGDYDGWQTSVER